MSETITRPNGKTYTPRKPIRQQFFTSDSDDDFVAVLGTHDIAKARAFARPSESYRCLVDPHLCWAKSTMRRGEPYLATDAVRDGAAGVVFREADEVTAVQAAEILGNSVQFVSHLIGSGELRTFKLLGEVFIPAIEMIALQQRRGVASRDVSDAFARAGSSLDALTARAAGLTPERGAELLGA